MKLNADDYNDEGFRQGFKIGYRFKVKNEAIVWAIKKLRECEIPFSEAELKAIIMEDYHVDATGIDFYFD